MIAAHWTTAFHSLVDLHRASPPRRDEHGTWTLAFDCVMSSAPRILGELPGVWTLVEHEERELGGVDSALVSQVWACDAERAVFACIDHWQAGLFGTLRVYAVDARYAEALRAVGEAKQAV
jgi:hypothetical protein